MTILDIKWKEHLNRLEKINSLSSDDDEPMTKLMRIADENESFYKTLAQYKKQEEKEQLEESLNDITSLLFGTPAQILDRLGEDNVQKFIENGSKYMSPLKAALQTEMRNRGFSDDINCEPKRKPITLQNGPELIDKQIKGAKKLLAKELKSLSKDFEKMAEDIDTRNFISDNLETIKEYILGIRAYRALIKPFHDYKNSEDIEASMVHAIDYFNGEADKDRALDEEWIEFNGKRISETEYVKQHVGTGLKFLEDTLEEQNEFGAPMFTRDPEYTIDLDTGKTYSKKRKYTVPAAQAALNTFNLTSLIVKTFPGLLAMLKNYRESLDLQISKRKAKVSIKQSDSA